MNYKNMRVDASVVDVRGTRQRLIVCPYCARRGEYLVVGEGPLPLAPKKRGKEPHLCERCGAVLHWVVGTPDRKSAR